MQSYSTLKKNPKLEAILEKLYLKVFSLIINNQESKTNYIYSNKLLKTLNAKAKPVLKQT